MKTLHQRRVEADSAKMRPFRRAEALANNVLGWAEAEGMSGIDARTNGNEVEISKGQTKLRAVALGDESWFVEGIAMVLNDDQVLDAVLEFLSITTIPWS
jgi:hypothetical protein